jgi:hypothetical protein
MVASAGRHGQWRTDDFAGTDGPLAGRRRPTAPRYAKGSRTSMRGKRR